MPYRLPAFADAIGPIYVVEGEKDCERPLKNFVEM